MLADALIRIGRPIANSNMSNEERIRWLSDCESPNCKNYFQNVFIVELKEDEAAFHYLILGNKDGDDFIVDHTRCVAFPILYPQGGNPLNAQGIYPVSCYLMYDPHIKMMGDPNQFTGVVFSRLKRTITFRDKKEHQLKKLALKISKVVADNFSFFNSKEKQLGILYVIDHELPSFIVMEKRKSDSRYLWITESKLIKGAHLYLDGNQALDGIIESKFMEAKELGYEKEGISTFTHERTVVASIYNKFWLWLSPTWEMPRSIYWDKNEWTKGIKIDRKSYESYLYGTQYIKQITVPISSAILKEMFAPVSNAEAKKYMNWNSFETIYGVPLVTPLLEGDSEQLYKKYLRILKNEKAEDDIQLSLLAGIEKSLPKMSNEHRISFLYYSGDLSRGNMHIRLLIENILPSTAETLQKIIQKLNRVERFKIQKFFGLIYEKQSHRTSSLPALLSNAYGPGYVWSTMQAIFQHHPITVDRLFESTSQKLTEMANKEDHWGMKDELVFHYAFLYFYQQYCKEILKKEAGVKTVSEWNNLLEKYYTGDITLKDLQSAENLGFISGLLIKQFSNSYHYKTGKDFLKHRVMKFGSKLTPEMIWKSGLIRSKELEEQWELNIAKNYDPVLANALLSFLHLDKNNSLTREKEKFLTAFWSGYLMYQIKKQGGKEDVSQ